VYFECFSVSVRERERIKTMVADLQPASIGQLLVTAKDTPCRLQVAGGGLDATGHIRRMYGAAL